MSRVSRIGPALTAFALTLAVTRAHAAPEPKLLVQNATIFSMAPDQPAPFHGWFTVSTDGTLERLRPGDPPPGLKARTIFDAHNHWIMPGFISAHSHLWQAAWRGLAADQTLTGWLTALYGETASRAQPEDFYWFTLSGALDHLLHGVTTAYNFNRGAPPLDADGTEAIDRASFRGEADSGIRFVHGIDATDGEPGTPADALRHVGGFLKWSRTQSGRDRMLSVMLNGVAAFRPTIEDARTEALVMKTYHLGNQSHYLEPPDKIEEEQKKFPWFIQTGLLGPDLIFGHFIHTTPDIIARTAQAHAAMAWNPLSNGRLASGVPDIPAYLRAGIRVGMGVDGEASADLVDPFENMRAGLYAIRDKYQNAAIMSPADVVHLHTAGSAGVLGETTRLGTLEPGKYADFLVIDPTYFGHVFDPYATLVFVASEQDLERVYIGGEQMTDHGHLLRQDLQHVQAETDRRVAAALQKPVPAK
ncbi:amidohydrolase family protein [Acetobacter oeni]|uniref:8-oxoguanine deaminase n=1 Tax=Acetobacter oeni TaxID=304077 RepID=A0A511XMF6_9PROT|nr:amidohydrolase family protein [Acetobacter oeni]MBB3883669.1 cytosine/adenosine deaminase-related metal-dependent hydrolase [Acetobacter oeni]NHO19748.1 amidohydrolase family protein [Acetobacter oeni]GBR02917.1 hydroxydechloroatrazine ethylaminohydrolase [Acetobacter oeni LMG 21952]GEN64130.1 8-oxoguanine deaminase [Acetobacter oeni]